MYSLKQSFVKSFKALPDATDKGALLKRTLRKRKVPVNERKSIWDSFSLCMDLFKRSEPNDVKEETLMELIRCFNNQDYYADIFMVDGAEPVFKDFGRNFKDKKNKRFRRVI